MELQAALILGLPATVTLPARAPAGASAGASNAGGHFPLAELGYGRSRPASKVLCGHRRASPGRTSLAGLRLATRGQLLPLSRPLLPPGLHHGAERPSERQVAPRDGEWPLEGALGRADREAAAAGRAHSAKPPGHQGKGQVKQQAHENKIGTGLRWVKMLACPAELHSTSLLISTLSPPATAFSLQKTIPLLGSPPRVQARLRSPEPACDRRSLPCGPSKGEMPSFLSKKEALPSSPKAETCCRRQHWRQTALANSRSHYAAMTGMAGATHMLLEVAPAAALTADTAGMVPLHHAVKRFGTDGREVGRQEGMCLLLEAAPEAATGTGLHGMLPLQWAAHFGKVAAVRLLLKAFPAAAAMRVGRPRELALVLALESALGLLAHWAPYSACSALIRPPDQWPALFPPSMLAHGRRGRNLGPASPGTERCRAPVSGGG